MMEQSCLAGARRCDNQTALAHAERRHQIHDPRRVTIGNGFELNPLVWVDRGQLLERAEPLIFGRVFAVNGQQLDQLRAAAATTRFTINPHAVTQGKAAHDFGSNENVLGRLDEVAFRIAEKTETLARNLDDAFAELRLALDLVTFWRALHCFGGDRVASSRAGRVAARFFVGLVEIVSAIAAVVITPASVAAPSTMTTLLG